MTLLLSYRTALTIMAFSTEDWEEKIANPDPRIKWAMDVMDQEGQDFEVITNQRPRDQSEASICMYRSH